MRDVGLLCLFAACLFGYAGACHTDMPIFFLIAVVYATVGGVLVLGKDRP